MELPQFLHDMDNLGILGGIQFNFPWIYKILSLIPVPRVSHFYASRQRMVEVGQYPRFSLLALTTSVRQECP